MGDVGQDTAGHDLDGGCFTPDEFAEVTPLLRLDLAGLLDLIDHILTEHEAAGQFWLVGGGGNLVNMKSNSGSRAQLALRLSAACKILAKSREGNLPLLVRFIPLGHETKVGDLEWVLEKIHNDLVELIDELLDRCLRFIAHVRDAEGDAFDLSVSAIDQNIVLGT